MQGLLLIKQGNVEAGTEILRPTIGQLLEKNYWFWANFFQADLASAMATAGREAEALASIDESLTGAELRHEGWQLAELLRIKGEILRGRDVDAAEDCFGRSLELARHQHALSWELRTAVSLTRLRMAQGRGVDAKSMLQDVYNRFTEGFDTADLLVARDLLGELRGAPEPSPVQRPITSQKRNGAALH
jgi:predicted ATPase